MANNFRSTREKRVINKNMREHNVLSAIIDERIGTDGQIRPYKHVDKYDKTEWNNGVSWFNSGLSINDADDLHKNNSNFIRGYEYAKRLSSINQKALEDGKNWFLKGNELSDASPRLLENENFIKGFNEAKENSANKSL